MRPNLLPLLCCVVLLTATNPATAAGVIDPVHYFDEERSKYIRLTTSLQVWLRHTDLNPGSQVSGSTVEDDHAVATAGAAGA